MNKPSRDTGEIWNGIDAEDVADCLGIRNKLQRVTLPFPNDTDNLWIIANYEFHNADKGELLPNTGVGLTQEYEFAHEAVAIGHQVKRCSMAGVLKEDFDVAKICAKDEYKFGTWIIEKHSSSNRTASSSRNILSVKANQSRSELSDTGS
jgi:hypothetical protein